MSNAKRVPGVPYTPTITLNYDDNPVVIYATTDEHGNHGFQFNIRKDLHDDPSAVRGMLSLLGRCSVQWYMQEFGSLTPPPDLAGGV